MKFVIAPDSFKNCMTASEVALAMKKGLMRVFPEAEYTLVPMADGGEGTTEALVDATKGKYLLVQVHDPLFRKITAKYGFLGQGKTAVIEMAQASGIQYVDEKSKDPLTATTYGTGEMILDAINHGACKIILGLGGSATNDAGAGMAQALGVKLLDQNGDELGLGAGNLATLAKIDTSQINPAIKDVKFYLASDVTNPLTGPNGASAVFGQQKGATAKTIPILDQNLKRFAQVVQHDLKQDYADLPGAGAAGGLGYGMLVFTKAKMQKGVDLVIEYSGLKSKLADADYVFSGEGSTDFQTKFGKTPYGVGLISKKIAPNAPVYLLSGNVGKGAEDLYQDGIIDAIFSTPSGAKVLADAIHDAPEDIAQTAEEVGRVIRADLAKK